MGSNITMGTNLNNKVMTIQTKIINMSKYFIVRRVVICDCLVKGKPIRDKVIEIEKKFCKDEYNMNDVQNYIKGGEELLHREKYFSNGCITQLNRDGSIRDLTNR